MHEISKVKIKKVPLECFLAIPLLRSGKEQPPAERRAPCCIFGDFGASVHSLYEFNMSAAMFGVLIYDL